MNQMINTEKDMALLLTCILDYLISKTENTSIAYLLENVPINSLCPPLCL